jgi:hypothetical protein
MEIHGVIPAQQFAQKIGDRLYLTAPRMIFTQGNKPSALKVYLYQLNPAGPGDGYPLVHDPDFASAGGCSISLINPGGTPFTLATATLEPIRNGWAGEIELNTSEVASFLGSLPDRECFLSVDTDDGDGGNPFTPFQAPVLLRSNASGTATPLPGINSGNGNDLEVSAAGITDLVPTQLFFQWTQRVTALAGSGAYTHILTLDNSKARDGSIYRVNIALPASANPTIEIRDNTGGGTLLQTVPGDSDNPTAFSFEAEYDAETSSWRKLTGQYQ